MINKQRKETSTKPVSTDVILSNFNTTGNMLIRPPPGTAVPAGYVLPSQILM